MSGASRVGSGLDLRAGERSGIIGCMCDLLGVPQGDTIMIADSASSPRAGISDRDRFVVVYGYNNYGDNVRGHFARIFNYDYGNYRPF